MKCTKDFKDVHPLWQKVFKHKLTKFNKYKVKTSSFTNNSSRALLIDFY